MRALIGVDPHKRSQPAVAIDGYERRLAELSARAAKDQAQQLLSATRSPERRWAIEAAGVLDGAQTESVRTAVDRAGARRMPGVRRGLRLSGRRSSRNDSESHRS
jgi:multidrug resistance efflux pump